MAGGIAFLFRLFGGEPYGAVYAALFVNAVLPLIRFFENRILYEKK
jgi:Na+-translocating ferredoxin:NAD+ oxidoreductase RnfD subunit